MDGNNLEHQEFYLSEFKTFWIIKNVLYFCQVAIATICDG